MEIDDEIWKNMSSIGFSKYDVSNCGKIRNVCTQYVRRLKPRSDGYITTSIRNDMGDLISLSVHRVVAKIFIPNPEQKSTVDHIDKNRSNNKSSNLRWASYIEQCKNRKKIINRQGRSINQCTLDDTYIKTWSSIKNAALSLNINETSIARTLNGRFKSGGGYKWKYNDGDHIGEIWQLVPIEIKNIYASNYGRIKNSNGHILNGNNHNGYINIKLSNNKHYQVHRLVCLTFNGLPPDDMRIYVNHIDGNKSNNRSDNLEWISHSENISHAYDIGLINNKAISKSLIKHTLDGSYIEKYNSITAGSNAMDTNRKSIVSAITNNSGIYGGFLWKLENDNVHDIQLKIKPKIKIGLKSKPKIKINLKAL